MIGARIKKWMAMVRGWLLNNHKPVTLMLIYLGLAIGYNAIIPIFEASDENNHFFFARELALTGHIPDVRFEDGPWSQQATQGPLYYLTAALPVATVDTGDADSLIAHFNPFVNLGDGSRPGNKNAWIHDPVREAWPWQRAVLAVHIARLISAGYGALTVWFVYHLAQRLNPRSAPIAGLLVAVLPQFVWAGGSATNDTAIAAAAAFALWVFVASSPEWPVRNLVALGAALALAALAKAPGLILSAYLIGVLALRALPQRLARLPKRMSVVLPVFFVTSGPWLLMNWIRYGDPTGLSAHLSAMSHSSIVFLNADALRNLFPPDLVRAIPAYVIAAFTSFWGVFGLHNILAPAEVYGGLNWLAFVGFAGFGLGLVWPVRDMRRGSRREALILLGWLVLHLITLIYWAYRSGGGPGRLLFPSLPVIACLWAVGWLRLADWIGSPPFAKAFSSGLPGLLGVFAVAAPGWLILPAYRIPPAVSGLPASAMPRTIVYGDLELLGIEAQPVVHPNELFQVTFYWRLKRLTPHTYVVFPRLLDYDLTPVAGTNAYPGWGNWPTQLWEPGRIYADRYQLPVAADAIRPGRGRVLLAVEVDGVFQSPQSPDGTGLDPADALAWVGLAPAPVPDKTHESLATFGDAVRLIQVDYPASVTRPESLKVNLVWQAAPQPTAGDWKRFIHLDDGNRAQPKLFAQLDTIPAHGFGVPWWEPGMVVPDASTLPLGPEVPPGRYALWIGFVDPAGNRVAITGGTHQDGRLELGMVDVH